MTPITLQAVINDLGNLPAAPAVVMQLMDYLERDEVEGKEVARLIAQDPVLAAKCLSLANSSVYAVQRRVATIQDALVVVGQQALTAMVSAMAVTDRFQRLQIKGRDPRKFWLHSICTAFCARALARHTRINPETAFVTGLIHDIGQLALAARFPEHFAAVIEYQRDKDCRMIDAEKRVLGFTHAQVGEAAAEVMHFTPEVARAVGGHHDPEDHPASTLTSLIHVADVLGHVLDFAQDENDLAPRIAEYALDRLSLDWAALKQIMAEVAVQRQDADLFLN
ncbi:MAG: HDOD domain-containing protein [Sterolibacterium sp.]|nr:HDOD domain-containing protein [Sterolibacterium sp.]